ncbi:MAG: O-antigen ligase family protein [Acidobacteriota bacterium]
MSVCTVVWVGAWVAQVFLVAPGPARGVMWSGGAMLVAFVTYRLATNGPMVRRRRWRFGIMMTMIVVTAWGAVTGQGTVGDNEIAGWLTLVVPFVWVSLASKRRWPVVLGLVSTAWAVSWLVEVEARGALAALAVAFVVTLCLMTFFVAEGSSSRVRRGWIGLLCCALVIVAMGRSWLDGSVQGGTDGFVHALGARPSIWLHASHAALDVVWLGMGPGAFASIVQPLYPIPSIEQPLEDAHNLVLQLILDIGLPATLAYVGLFVLAWLRVVTGLRRGHPELDHGWLASLTMAGCAHALYGLADAVALGTPGHLSVAAWLGLALATRPSATTTRRPGRSFGIGIGVVVGAMTVAASIAPQTVVRQRVAWQAARGVEGSDPEAMAAARQRAGRAPGCHVRYLDGRLASLVGDHEASRVAWDRFLSCAPAAVSLVAAVAPEDRLLAERAVAYRPGDARAWRFLGRAADDRDIAIDALERAVALAPADGEAWLLLGDRWVMVDDRVALDAYGKACRHGDPRANGCVRAGRVAERLGRPRVAITWYERSRWPAARRRAAELRGELKATGATSSGRE